MFGSSYTVAKVFGIPIRVHISLLILLPFLANDYGLGTGILVGVGLFTSIALHELGHSVVALAKGCRVREILLMPIGGAAQLDRMPTRPMDEFLMAIAGPAVSLALAAAGIWGGQYVTVAPLVYAHPPINVVEFLGWVNFGLAFFNLLPSFPMDGGRVLRAALSPRMGRLRATYVAARLGKLMAVLFGLYGLFREDRNWSLVAIAFFIYIAAGNEYRAVRAQEAAHRGGGGPVWPPFFAQPPPLDSVASTADEDNTVIISPPPYDEGPDRKAEIRQTGKRDQWRGA